LDPRLRLLAFLVIVIWLSLSLRPPVFLILSATLLAGAISLRPGVALMKSMMLPLISMVLITLLLHLLFSHKNGTPLLTMSGLILTKEALVQGLYFSWRIVLFLLAAVCFSAAMTPDQFAGAVWRGIAPLRKIGVPTDEIGLAFFVSVRFIPETFQQYRQIKLAQMARGADFGGGVLARTRKMIPLLVPVTVATLRRSAALSECLLVRSWGVTSGRSYYGWGRLKTGDYVFALALIALMAILLIV
jgi:energy-coupling factor transport system permease protein